MSEEPEDWELHPLFMSSQPTPEQIEKSAALKGINDLLYNADPIDLIGTYRTQGNNKLTVAQNCKDEAKKEQLLNETLNLYYQAANVKIQASEVITQQMIDEKLSVVYSNISEVLRLLNQFQNAFYYADKAAVLDPANFKPIFRKGRVCADIGDFARAVYYYKHAWDMCVKDDVLKKLTEAREKLSAKESELVGISAKVGSCIQKDGWRIGCLLPHVNLNADQIKESWGPSRQANIYIMNTKTNQIDTIQMFSLMRTVKELKTIFGDIKADIFYYRNQVDYLVNDKIQLAMKERPKCTLTDNLSILDLLCDFEKHQYIIPGIVTLYLE